VKRTYVLLGLLLPLVGCPDGGPSTPPAADTPQPLASDVHAAAAAGDAEALGRELKRDGVNLDARTALKLTLKELQQNDDPAEWLKVYLKHRQLLNAAVYCYLPFMCKNAGGKLKEDVGDLLNAVREDPRRLLEKESYALLKELTPLHLAALYCHEQVVRALIEAGADVDAKDALGLTPLHYASCASVAALLLDAGADVDAAGATGLTPLHLALDRPLARLLIARGADKNKRDACGNTPLHLAAVNGLDMRSARRRALEPGVTFSTTAAPAPEQGSLAAWLVRLGFELDRALRDLLESFDVAGELLDQGATPGVPNDAGKTPDDVYSELRSRGHDWDD